MRLQVEGAEKVTREQALEENELCSFPLSATAFAAGPQFRRGVLAAARGRPVERHGGLQRKEAEVATKGL